MPSSSTGQTASATWTEPPWCGWIETTGDALLILEAARRGLIPRVTRRLVDSERKMITSGSVFVFDEDESGIKRWTDGFFWSPSRILGNFLLYRETDKRATNRGRGSGNGGDSPEAADEGNTLSRPRDVSQHGLERQRERNLMGSLTNNPKFKSDGLMKKTFSLTIGGVAQHLISYYRVEDVENGRLRSPSSLPELASLSISPEYLDKTHFRNPPKVEIGPDGVPRYRGEADDVEIGLGISRPPRPPPPLTVSPPLLSEGTVRGPGSANTSANVTSNNGRYKPYENPRSRRQRSITEGDSTPSPVATTPAQAAATTPPTPNADLAQIPTPVSTIASPANSTSSPSQTSSQPPSLYPETQTQTQTQPHFPYPYYPQTQSYPYPPVYAYPHPPATSSAGPAQPTASSPHSAISPSSNNATSPAPGTYSSTSVVPYPYDANAAGAQHQQTIYYPYGFGYPAWTTPPYGYPVQQSSPVSGTERQSDEGDEPPP